jgi:Ca2+-binding RTX toxin-like protein
VHLSAVGHIFFFTEAAAQWNASLATIVGTGANDTLFGTNENDRSWGLAGQNDLHGGEGDDLLDGGDDYGVLIEGATLADLSAGDVVFTWGLLRTWSGGFGMTSVEFQPKSISIEECFYRLPLAEQEGIGHVAKWSHVDI